MLLPPVLVFPGEDTPHLECVFAEFPGEKAGEDAGDGATDIGRRIHDAGVLLWIQAEGRVQPNEGPAVKAFGGDHRKE